MTSFRAIEKLSLDALRNLEGVKPEAKAQKSGDIMDGLIVALDMLSRHCGTKKYKKRIFVITDGEKEAKCSAEERRQVIESMNETDTRLNVITLDFCDDLDEDEDEEEEEAPEQKKAKPATSETRAQQANRALLQDLTSKVKGAIFPASVAMQIYQQFKKREVAARSKYRGHLDLAAQLKLSVQIFSRTREETFPTLKKQSLVAAESASAREGLVKLDRTLAEVDDPEQNPVEPDKQIKGYNYGKQLVPVGKEHEHVLKYKGGNQGSQETTKKDD